MNDFFEKVVCINLDDRKDRWNDCVAIFRKHFLEVERLPAIYGKDLNIPYTEGFWYHGQLGSGLSHLFAVKYAKQLGLKNILILEDDVDFHDDLYPIFDQVLKELPSNWDFLYLGGIHLDMPTTFSKHLARITNTLSIHAYAVNHTAYDIAIKALMDMEESSDQNFRKKLQKDHNFFVTNPHLAWQRSGYSTTMGMHVDLSVTKYFPGT